MKAWETRELLDLFDLLVSLEEEKHCELCGNIYLVITILETSHECTNLSNNSTM